MRRVSLTFSILCLLTFLVQCSTCRITKHPIEQTIDGRKVVKWESIPLKLSLYGDYKIHERKKDVFPMGIPKSLEETFCNKETETLLKAHTILEPIGNLWITLSDSSSNSLLFTEYNVRIVAQKKTLVHTYERNNLVFINYQIEVENRILSFLFWTKPDQDDWLKRESEAIMATIEF